MQPFKLICVWMLANWIVGGSFTTTTTAALMFTAVPPSANPSSKLNLDLQQRLRDNLHVQVHEIQKGRIRFSPTPATLPHSEWPMALSTVHSIRWIVAEVTDLTAADDAASIATKLEKVLTNISIQDILQMYKSFGNSIDGCLEDEKTGKEKVIDATLVFDLSCRRWACCIIPKANISTLQLSHELRRVVAQRYLWAPHYRAQHGSNVDLEFQVVLHDTRCWVELILLVPPSAAAHGNLPRPGCKRVEAWALVQSAVWPNNNNDKNDKDHDRPHVILDPLCGKATFLVEAATTINNRPCRYVGVDKSATQLQDAQQNVDETNVAVELHQGDARSLDFLADDSVDVILTCPPFGRQFGEDISDLAVFYRECLTEWMRVLVTEGRVAVLIDTGNAETMLDAMLGTGVLQVQVHREPFRLGRLQATVMVAVKCNNNVATDNPHVSAPSKVLPWEGAEPLTRAGWTRLRAASLPCLVPYKQH